MLEVDPTNSSAECRRRSVAAGVLLAGLAVAGLSVPATADAAASLPSNCSQQSVGGMVSCTFAYTGSAQSFVVPSGISALTVIATGAGGAGYAPALGRYGGSGATVETSFDVAASSNDTTGALRPGQSLAVVVGGAGQAGSTTGSVGGFNGGGGSPMYGGGYTGGGGGGASDVRTDGAVDLATNDTRLVVAGGGGGEGDCATSPGGNAGVLGAGSDGQVSSSCPAPANPVVGGGGTLSAGGSSAAGAGALGRGGDGNHAGGGGGGGVYGGGGGSAAGGGGGSSDVDTRFPGGGHTAVSFVANNRYENGSVTFQYSPGAAQLVMVSPGTSSVALGQSVASSAITYDANGASVADVSNSATFGIVGPNGEVGSCTSNSCTPAAVGANTIVVTSGSLTSSAALTVTKGTASTSLSAAPSSGQTYPEDVSLTAVVSGATGAASPTGTVAFTATSGGTTTTLCSAAPLSTSSGVTSATCTPSAVLTPGTYSFSAIYSSDGNYNAGTAGSVATYTVSPAAQTVTFGPGPLSVEAGLSTTVTASGGGSSQPVVIGRDASTSAGACTVTSTGNGTASVQYTHPGVCVLDADQAGDDNYTAASQAQRAVQVVARYSSITLSTPATAVFGQPVTATAHVSVFDGTTPAGSVQFSVAGNPIGSPVALGASGTATSPNLSFAGGRQLDPGSAPLDASFEPSSGDYAGSTATTTAVTITKATTTTAVTADASSISATVAPVAPGAGTPTGTVTFSVAGTSVGQAQLTNGVATLAYSAPAGNPGELSAVYAGSTDFTGSSASTARSNPTITATVTSNRPKSRDGWYSDGVTVGFTCTPGSAPLAAACPSPVTLTHDGAGQSVTRTVTATDGGTATASVTGLNLDSTVPTVGVRGVTDGGTVFGHATPTCAGTDALSGLASCTIALTRVSHSGSALDPTVFAYKVTAVDRAGNTNIATGRYTSLGIYLAGATYRDGVFHVKYGRSYPVTVFGYSSTPNFQYAVGYNGTPTETGPALTNTGNRTWAITLPINSTFASRHDWNIGILTGDGVQHIIHIRQ